VAVKPGMAATSTEPPAPVNGLSGTLAHTPRVSPARLTCTLAPTSIVLGASQGSTLSCTGTAANVYTVTVTGTSGSLTHTATVTVTVRDFTVTASPTSVTALANAAGASTIPVA